jgi:hypothetical protein
MKILIFKIKQWFEKALEEYEEHKIKKEGKKEAYKKAKEDEKS